MESAQAEEQGEELKDQRYFPQGSHLEIQKQIARIIRKASSSVWVYDPYMDEKLVEEMSGVNASDIRLLTENLSPLLKQRFEALSRQYPTKSIGLKIFNASHDRFYVIDQTYVWVLGASYNLAGGKATFLMKVVVTAEKQKIVKDFEIWWKAASGLEKLQAVVKTRQDKG